MRHRYVTHRLLLDVSSLTYRAYFALKEPGVFAQGRAPGRRRARLPRHGHEADRRSAARRGRARLRPRLASDHPHRHVPGLQGGAPARARGPDPAVRAAARGARSHRHAAGPDRGLGGRGRDRRLLHRGHRGRPHRHRQRRPRPDPAGARPRRAAAVHRARRLGARRVRRGGRAREVRRARRPLRRVRDPARRPLRRPARRPRRRREDRPRPGRRVPVDRGDARGRGGRQLAASSRPFGQTCSTRATTWPRCSGSCP